MRILNDRKKEGLCLIVDDSREWRELIARYVSEKTNLKYVACADGLQALRLLAIEPNNFDYVIIDLGLPHLSGFELINIMRERGYDQKILILSNHDFEIAHVEKVRKNDFTLTSLDSFFQS